jgi:hypothetical protein
MLAISAGCQKPPANNANPAPAVSAAAVEAELKAALSKLAPEDQLLAERQKYCAVMPAVRLGEMGTPLKVTIRGEVLYVCCENCLSPAGDDADKTLAQWKEVKDRAAAESRK